MKNPYDKKDDIENSKLESPVYKPMIYSISPTPNHQNNKFKVPNCAQEPIFLTATEPTVVESRIKQNNQDNLIRRYNQIDSGQPVHLKSFSQQRSDRFLIKKKDRHRSHHTQAPQELSALDFQENSSIFGGVATTTATTTKKNQQKQKKSQGNKLSEKMKTNQDLLDEHMSNFEWLMQLKSQQLQKNMHIMFLKNEKKKLMNSQSKMINLTDPNLENLCISPSKQNNLAMYENMNTKSNEFDFIIKQEKYLNQKIQRDVNQKQETNNGVHSTPTTQNGNDLNPDDKILLKINQQANKLNNNKQQVIRLNKHSQGLQSPLSSIKKELQAYNEDFCLPYLQPFRGINNKTKIYMLNKQKGKKGHYRDSSLNNYSNNGSKLTQYNLSPESTLSPNSNYRKNLDSNLNLLSEYQQPQFIKEEKLKYHVESSYINKEEPDGDELYTEHFKSPLSLQLYDPNKLESERFKLTFRKKSNTAQLGSVYESSQRKDSFSQVSNYQEGEVAGKNQTQSSMGNNQNNLQKAIRIKLKQSPLSTDLNNIQCSTEKVKYTETLQNNQIVLPHLNIKSYHQNKLQTQNIENVDFSQPIQKQSANEFNHMEETSADFFQLQNYYQKKYNNNDKIPKSFSQNREVLSYQNSLTKNARQLHYAHSLLTEYDQIEEPFKSQTTKRRSSSFFSSPQKSKKNKHVLQIQNSLQINPFSNIAQPSKKTNQQNLTNDLQPWEDQQNFNETNFFQIVKERTDKTTRNSRKVSASDSSQDERQSGKSSEYYYE